MSLVNIEHHDGSTAGAHPIFFDQRGTRWRRICALLIATLFLATGTLLYVVPRMMAPLWQVQTNRGSDVPRHIAYSVQPTWPMIGSGSLVRVVRIQWQDGQAFAADPFSNTIFHPLTGDNTEAVRGRPYALEKYSAVPAKTLIITFDDGPDPKWTPKILDVLAAEKTPATFFDIGVNMTKNPQLVQRAIREGHLVAGHTVTHIDFDDKSSLRGQQELIAEDHISRAIGGVATRFVRPPYIGCSQEDIKGGLVESRRAVLASQQLGYYPTCFDLDTDDWSWKAGHPGPLPDLSDGKGHVVLMHDAGGDRSMSVTYLQDLIHEAKAQGYTFSTVAALGPHGFEAPKHIVPTLADHAAFWMANGILVVPGMLVGGLFDLNVVTIAVVTIFTLLLATVSTRRSRRRQWSTDYRPFVSVVIAAFNEEKVIARTLDAISRSTYPNYEVIVINDGSTDGTLGLLLEIADRWQRDGRELWILNQPNTGKWAALNNGTRQAKSDILVTLDADTIFMPNTMGNLVRHFEDSDVGAVAGVVKVGNVRNLLTAWQSLDYLSGIATDRTAQQLLGGIMIVPGACAAWRKFAVTRAGGYTDATLAEDQDLTLGIHRMGFKVVQENQAVALTEAPSSPRDLIKQRFRWTFGSLQAMWKNRGMFLRPRYGGLSMIVMPYTATSILIPLAFLPVTYMILVEALLSGHYRTVMGFAVLFLVVHFVTTFAAIVILRERWWHLLIVPFYRLINEPLRVYLLYATLLTALRGRAVGWNKIQRKGDVTARHLSAIGPVLAEEQA